MPFFGNFQVSFLHIVGLLGIEVVSHTSKNKYVELYSPLTFLFFFGVLLLKRSKTKKLKEEGGSAVYVEQNHRPQLFCTRDDTGTMEAAWELTAAHREDLAGRSGNPQGAALVVRNGPSAMDMLRARE